MTHSLTFQVRHDYEKSRSVLGISLPVVLSYGGKVVDLECWLDTGAAHCIFERQCGETLGLDVERGNPRSFSTASGHFLAFGHDVTISCLGFEFESHVFFADIRRNVLGQIGWPDRMRVGLFTTKAGFT